MFLVYGAIQRVILRHSSTLCTLLQVTLALALVVLGAGDRRPPPLAVLPNRLDLFIVFELVNHKVLRGCLVCALAALNE